MSNNLLGVSMKLQAGGNALIPRAHSTSPTAKPNPALSEVPDVKTTLNTSDQLMNLDALECSRRRCSGNGRCVETNGDTTCVCSAAYSGDSCQEHYLRTMRGPIVCGAAGLCVGVVIIIVIGVVVNRRKAANTRFV